MCVSVMTLCIKTVTILSKVGYFLQSIVQCCSVKPLEPAHGFSRIVWRKNIHI